MCVITQVRQAADSPPQAFLSRRYTHMHACRRIGTAGYLVSPQPPRLFAPLPDELVTRVSSPFLNRLGAEDVLYTHNLDHCPPMNPMEERKKDKTIHRPAHSHRPSHRTDNPHPIRPSPKTRVFSNTTPRPPFHDTPWRRVTSHQLATQPQRAGQPMYE